MIDTSSLIEVKLNDEQSFLKICETLTRIGVASYKTKTLYQSVHLLHKGGKYYLVHFKELFALDNKPVELTEEDVGRRDAVVFLLKKWGLCTPVVERESFSVGKTPKIKVVPFAEKGDWNLVQKYRLGKKGKYNE